MTTKRKPTILIVDDDLQVLKSLKIWLKNEGFKPMTATNGDEAMEILHEQVVDIALVDFRMSKEDGISVAQHLKEFDNSIQIIMLTGFPSYETAVKAMKVGIFDYISKGSANEKILEVIHKAFEERQRLGIPPEQNIPVNRTVRIILFCNHSLLKERLENYSKHNPGFRLVRSFSSMESTPLKLVSQQIDVALLCAGCHIKNFDDAFQVIPKLYRSFPDIKPVIINESFSDREKVELLKLGVRGFSSKDLSSEDLEKALYRVKEGEVWVNRNVINLSLQNMASYNSSHILQGKDRFSLTEREIEILRTMALGLKNKEIAEKLFISEKTVKTHINRVFKKLEVDTRAKAILKAVENQIM